ncbi:AAA family ATPase [Pseudomonas sp. RTC3]|uniref:TrlF family AAA-like ATPase n=1 Tax=Pseudomonas sp. 5C2 TaxID=3048588 RepID=UPI002AB55719|nr:AAA family ATPase [Pseudomonas sp. 5C2]MDY7564703.1 AAA family ATPase [Pseudomonas sp. 5C2]MEB0060650.1 AAA family ATPase [Pseudomonas sp. RTC3]
MSEYQGMRWVKADFQVQTPEDSKNWADPELRLGNPRRPKTGNVACELDIQNKARVFLKRCHELGLQLIGITDHNFSALTDPRDWFLTHLLEQNKSVAKELGRERIHIMPGFEVDIGYHVLCLFEPTGKAGDLEHVNKVLIQLGLPESRRFEKGESTPLRREDATISLAKLLRVVQDIHGGIVIAAHADQEDGLLQRSSNRADYQLTDLLALEVTQYPMSPRIADILLGKNREWSRGGKQPAYVQSSDAKSLKTDKDGNPRPNSLGYRSTWVKCSTPSIAALKQAFLDSASRISLEKIRPSDRETYPRIVSMSVKGLRFLEDQTITFSHNLNAMIGARGTGKSTILELLRIMFARETSDALSAKVQLKAKRAKETFTPETEIEVRWEGIVGQPDTIRFTSAEGLSLAVGEAHDLSAYLRHLPVQFYSQQQLSDLTAPGGQPQLLELIDEACAAELEKLHGEERTVAADISRLFAAKDQIVAIEAEITTLKQELVELERQWQARQDVQGEAAAYQNSQRAKRYYKVLSDRFADDVKAVERALESMAAPDDPSVMITDAWPHSAWFTTHAAEVNASRAAFRSKLESLVREMLSESARLFKQNEQWQAVSADLDTAQTVFLAACEDKGVQPQDVSRLQELDRTKLAKQKSLDDKKRQCEALEGTHQALDASLQKLFEIWREQHKLRQQAADNITGKTGKSVKVFITPMGYKTKFDEFWMALEPDRRSRIGREWDRIGDAFWNSFLTCSCSKKSSPWEHITELLDDTSKLPEILLQFKKELPEFTETIVEKWRALRLKRVPDLIDIELYRPDGTFIGSIEGNQLSEGQRNTAILNMLLVKGDGPIVIDQPEDEVDASFIYKDLVPLLRQSKVQRQIILATHNANLPVNADSEFVYALKSEGGKGCVLAQGGMDRKPTATAILDIMEGSEEAFKRRFEKYHF